MLGSQGKRCVVQPRAGRGSRRGNSKTSQEYRRQGHSQESSSYPCLESFWGSMCLGETSSRHGAGNCPPSREKCERKREMPEGGGRRTGDRVRAKNMLGPGQATLSLKVQATPTFLIKRSQLQRSPLSRGSTPHPRAHPDPSPVGHPTQVPQRHTPKLCGSNCFILKYTWADPKRFGSGRKKR